MIKAIIVDDEKHSVATLAWKIENFCPEIKLVAQFTDSSEALSYIRDNQPELLFLDIEMPRLNGFELLDELGDAINFEVIFITAYDEFGIKAVKANALDYLLKPVQNQELKASIEKYKQKKLNEPDRESGNITNIKTNRIALATKESIEFVDPQEIISCSSDSNYTMIYLDGDRKKLISKTLKEVEQWLSPYGFFRTHHSHLVNVSHIKEYVRADGGYLLLSNNKEIPVSRNRKEDLLKMIQ